MKKEEQAQNRQEYREALQAIYGNGQGIAIYGNNQGMIDYCMKKAELIVNIRGFLFPIEKRKVEKRFCFGYSDCGQGQDYLTAIREADKARNESGYFKAENLRYYTDWIENIKSGNPIALCERYSKLSPVRFLRCLRWVDVLDAVGGSARLEDLKGTMVQIDGMEVYILTDEEKEIVREAFEQAMKAHEKKLDSYLKRYGTSKIRAWTYWLDD